MYVLQVIANEAISAAGLALPHRNETVRETKRTEIQCGRRIRRRHAASIELQDHHWLILQPNKLAKKL
jgi:hypothetical protein